MSKLEILRKIVADKQAMKVKGVYVDLFSASAILAVYDALKPDQQTKYEALSVLRMAQIAFKYVS